MKLAEALNARADAQKRLQQIRQRVQLSARHQEGESPAEDPNELLDEADRVASDLERLIAAINRTNVSIELEAGVSMTDALAHRDVLGLRRTVLAEAAQIGVRATGPIFEVRGQVRLGARRAGAPPRGRRDREGVPGARRADPGEELGGRAGGVSGSR